MKMILIELLPLPSLTANLVHTRFVEWNGKKKFPKSHNRDGGMSPKMLARRKKWHWLSDEIYIDGLQICVSIYTEYILCMYLDLALICKSFSLGH